MTHKYFPYYDSGNNTFTILFCSLVFSFDIMIFQTAYFYAKLFISILPMYRLKFLSLSIFFFQLRPESIFINIVAWFNENRLFYFLYFWLGKKKWLEIGWVDGKDIYLENLLNYVESHIFARSPFRGWSKANTQQIHNKV